MKNGMLYAVARGGEAVSANSDARFPWWSNTKPVLAAAVLRLVDAGKLSLDDFHDGKPYTIRQLLAHTSGLGTYGGAPYRAAVAAGEPAWPVAELLARVKAERLIFPPGEGWAYSNIGYLFIRQLIERQTERDIDAALRLLVFEPMGIADTRIANTRDDMDDVFWGNPQNYDPHWVYHGLLIGPPSDAVAFLRRLFSGNFLSRDSQLAMKTMHPLGGSIPERPWTKTGYGLGLMTGKMKDVGRVFGHSGVGPTASRRSTVFRNLPVTRMSRCSDAAPMKR